MAKFYLWVDIEATGLLYDKSIPVDRELMEIACVLTDDKLNILFKENYVNSVFHYNFTDNRVKTWHTTNGLIKECSKANTSCSLIEQQILSKLSGIVKDDDVLILSGSTITGDREMLRRTMPTLYERLHYRMLDVASIREMFLTYDKTRTQRDLKKRGKESVLHRAMSDILTTLEEYKYYVNRIKGIF